MQPELGGGDAPANTQLGDLLKEHIAGSIEQE